MLQKNKKVYENYFWAYNRTNIEILSITPGVLLLGNSKNGTANVTVPNIRRDRKDMTLKHLFCEAGSGSRDNQNWSGCLSLTI